MTAVPRLHPGALGECMECGFPADGVTIDSMACLGCGSDQIRVYAEESDDGQIGSDVALFLYAHKAAEFSAQVNENERLRRQVAELTIERNHYRQIAEEFLEAEELRDHAKLVARRGLPRDF